PAGPPAPPKVPTKVPPDCNPEQVPAEFDAAAAEADRPGIVGRPVSRDEILRDFEQRAPLEPAPAGEPQPAAGPPGRPRRLAVILHAHLPWVLGHGTWPHGEDWLAEAIVHCYLPLLDAFRRLAATGRRQFVTFSVTPVLGAMLD